MNEARATCSLLTPGGADLGGKLVIDLHRHAAPHHQFSVGAKVLPLIGNTTPQYRPTREEEGYNFEI